MLHFLNCFLILKAKLEFYSPGLHLVDDTTGHDRLTIGSAICSQVIMYYVLVFEIGNVTLQSGLSLLHNPDWLHSGELRNRLE